jgi:hypothetical protein
MADLVNGTPAGLGFRIGVTYIPAHVAYASKPPAGLPTTVPARRGLTLDLCDLEDSRV